MRFFKNIAVAVCATFVGGTASAADFSFTGAFSNVGQVQLFDIVTTGGQMTAVTFGWAGGTNNAGTMIPHGGFDPYLYLYDGNGFYVASDDDGRQVPDPISQIAYDSLLVLDLAPGTYTLALARYGTSNYGDLSDGFFNWDMYGFSYSKDWAVDILGVESASLGGTIQANVPIPAALPLLATGLAAFGLIRRRS